MFLPMQATGSISLIFHYLTTLMILFLGEDFILFYRVQTYPGNRSVVCPLSFVKGFLGVVMARA
jgi:hypothetical protein